MLFCRFIYVCNANGLITNGKKLFHILVCCVTGAFTLQWLGIQPLQYRLGVDNHPMNLVEEYICTETKITQFEDVHANINFSIKNKLILISSSVLFLMANLYFTLSSQRMKRRFKIPKRRINLLDMKNQTIYTASIIINVIINQILMGIIQLNYEELGEHNVFKIWWIFHLWEIMETHLFANIFIIYNMHQMNEFNGYIGRTFPGQEQPKASIVQPERDYVEVFVEAGINIPSEFLVKQTLSRDQCQSITATNGGSRKIRNFSSNSPLGLFGEKRIPGQSKSVAMVEVDIH